jgi:FMN-dependent oxidoreductase (nitrilotriacetate monooxygenase family)
MLRRLMKIGAMIGSTGNHAAGWRHPSADADGAISIAHNVRVAQLAEKGKLDFLFLADGLSVPNDDIASLSRSSQPFVGVFEPTTLLSALAMVTSRLGLIATASTTYNDPFTIARKFASLDHLSGGRSGWNLVTSNDQREAYNFSCEDHPDHDDRYGRAEEFADVVKGLWDTWDDDAFVRDKAGGLFFHPEKMHVLGHVGRHFSVRGPLSVPRSPQGQPLLVQAGASEPGRELSARCAEVMFTMQPTLEKAKLYYADVKGRMAKYGRAADDALIMPGVFVFVGKTEAEARAKFDEMYDLLDPVVALAYLERTAGVDLTRYSFDDPVPQDLPEFNGGLTRQKSLFDLARRENLTIGELAKRGAATGGHLTLIGSATQVADQLEEYFTEEGADGFVIKSPHLPGGLEDFLQLVIPELQRRGLFRTDYEGPTLRQNLGLRFPPSRYAAAKGGSRESA